MLITASLKPVLRFLAICLLGLLGLAALGAALFAYFIYSPDPPVPPLSGTLTRGSVDYDGLKRTYLTYVPKGLRKGAPLVVVMHGSGESGAQSRIETGYGFERLADAHGFALAYPDAISFDWNDCSKVGDFTVDGREVDDVGFLEALTDKLIAEGSVDPARIFATGVSSGGFMSLRLALEAPSRFRAVAAVSANLPAPENFKCKPNGKGTSVMVMNGTKDPLVPFAGGESSLLGLFYKGGYVRSSHQSVQYFAALNAMDNPPETRQMQLADGVNVEHILWRDNTKVEVELVAIDGGGHGIAQPYWRRPRLLGPSPMEPDGPKIIWSFFERQRR
jgi:polyhydroxybutyrate depolymerase